MSRPSGRRPSSCDQCGSTAATEPRRGQPRARWPTAMDGELGARGRAARPPGQSAGCRGARRRAPLIGTHTARVPAWTPAPVAAQVAGTRAAATAERSASGRSARRARGGTACFCRVRAGAAWVVDVSETSPLPGQPQRLGSPACSGGSAGSFGASRTREGRLRRSGSDARSPVVPVRQRRARAKRGLAFPRALQHPLEWLVVCRVLDTCRVWEVMGEWARNFFRSNS